MTEDEGLRELCIRAANKNLYFYYGAPVPGQPNATIETLDGQEIFDFLDLFGGRIVSARGGTRSAWVIRNEDAVALIYKLLPRKDFRNSGKFRYAVEILAAFTGVSVADIIREDYESYSD